MAKAVSETKSLDDDRLAGYLRANKFDTVIGPIEFGANGEWSTPRIICIQFRNVDDGGVGQFEDWTRQVVVFPPAYKTGDLVYPFAQTNMGK